MPLRSQSARVETKASNLQAYRTAEVVSHYAALDYLTACERLLFDTYIKPGMAILDLGVGGGRTTPVSFPEGGPLCGSGLFRRDGPILRA